MQLPVAPAPAPHSPFAPLQTRWMDELFGGPIPQERLATCSDCAKLDKPGRPHDPDSYNPATKCCTYLPMLHNFLVGSIIDDTDPSFETGRATVEARIDAGIAVTPVGLYATEEYLARYDAGARFGRDITLRCPHYLHEEGGRCGVWRHRESTCSSWFCKYERGELGKTFWKNGVAPLLRAAELALALHCATELGATETDFGRWEGHPRALYRAASNIVEHLPWSEVEAIGGAEVKKLANESKMRLEQIRQLVAAV